MYFDTIFTNFKCKCTYTSLKTTKVNCNEISHIYGWMYGGGGGCHLSMCMRTFEYVGLVKFKK